MREKKKHLLSCYSERPLSDAIEAIAAKESVSKSVIIRIALKRLIKQYQEDGCDVVCPQ